MSRVSIYIDIEGTSYLFEQDESTYYNALDTLLTTAAKICSLSFPDLSIRFFGHQIGGDGILLVSDFDLENLQIPVSISVAILQTLLQTGITGKVSISKGSFFGIRDCLPNLNSFLESGYDNPNSGGIMSLFGVMGTTLINSYKCMVNGPSGSLLLIDSSNFEISDIANFYHTNYENKTYIVDWIHSTSDALNFIYKKLNSKFLNSNELEEKLKYYLKSNTLNQNWIQNTLYFNGISSKH